MQNRSPLWALGGVLTGFALPLIGITVLMFACVFSFAVAGAASASEPAGAADHVSGPASGPAVAEIDINGTITSGQAGLFDTGPVAASGDIVPVIRRAAEDADVRAILLRVNSPGGSVVASDEIYHALKLSGKPVVVSMGELAASGGYYVSMAGQWIVANPNTLTGSIGVISEFPEAQGLLDKLGIMVTVIKSGENKDLGSMYRPMTPEEQALWQSVIDETYDSFVQVVAEGRKLPADKVRGLADGRVYTGRQALANGLIDSLGYEEDAIAKAASLGGITGTPRVIRYAPGVSLAALLTGRLGLPALSADYLRDLLAPSLEYRWTG
jgi:protease-4